MTSIKANFCLHSLDFSLLATVVSISLLLLFIIQAVILQRG